ncbi:MAG: peptidylprolyl isomerase [Candidatus Thiodiazotropha sp.]
MRFTLIGLIFLFLSSLTHAESPVMMFGGDITVKEIDLDSLLMEGPEKARQQVLEDKTKVLQLLRQTYLIRALADQAKQEGLDQDPMFQAKLRRTTERMLYLQKLKQIDEQPMPDFEQAAKEQYLGNPDKFSVPEKVEAKHILIATTDRLPVYHDRDEALKIAQQVKAEADAGAVFEDLVKLYSEDTLSNKNKGTLGVFSQGSMVKPVDDAVFAMKQPGEISDIVESQFGYHIIKLEKRFPPRKLAFEDVKSKIIEGMKKEFIQKRRETYFDELLKKNKASIYEDLVEDYMAKGLKPVAE